MRTIKRAGCIFLIAIIFLTSLSFFSCSSSAVAEKTFFMMDTPITVRLYTTEAEAKPHFDECKKIISDIEAKLSKTIEDSDISKINASEAAFEGASDETLRLLRMSLEISEKTGGAFDVTVASLVELWHECGERNSLPSETELADVLSLTGSDKITLENNTVHKANANVKIDLGGIGKGYAISRVLDYLKSTELSGGLVSFGSNVAVFGEKPDGSDYRVSLRSPFDANKTVGIFTLKDKVLSVSGDYERYVEIDGKKYHHILDPKSGYPTNNGLHTVAVIADDGALADALSTALFVMGLDAAIEFYERGEYEFEAVFVTDNGIYKTKGLDSFYES